MSTHDPRKHKALGREVRGFDATVWDKVGVDVVEKGNLAKFRQNPLFRQKLLATGSKVRVLYVRSACVLRVCVCSAYVLRVRALRARCVFFACVLRAPERCLFFLFIWLSRKRVFLRLTWLACCSV